MRLCTSLASNFLELATMRVVKSVVPTMGLETFWKAVATGAAAPATIYSPSQPYMEYANSVSEVGAAVLGYRPACMVHSTTSNHKAVVIRGSRQS